jgi:N-acetylglucosamine repressor
MFKNKPSDKVTPTHLKQHNETLLLRAIYAHNAISRVQLANITNLSRPSVSELTQGLIKRGLVDEIGPDQVTDKVGKKPTLLALNPDAHQMIAVLVGDIEIRAVLMNLRMQVIQRETVVSVHMIGDELINLLAQTIQRLIDVASRSLLGIAVGTPGIVDPETGMVHLATNLGWVDLPLMSILAQKFNLPIVIGNDSNLAAVGEHRHGIGQGVDNLIVIRVGGGIGAGILAGGEIVHGSAYSAGELGHIPFSTLSDVCICGRRGCLETLVSLWGLANHARRIAQECPDSLLNKFSRNGDIDLAVIREAVEQEDTQALQLIESTGVHLGQALILAITLLNPARVILTGRLLQLGDPFVREVRRTVEGRAVPYIASHTEIALTQLGDEAILLGAGAMLLEKTLGL